MWGKKSYQNRGTLDTGIDEKATTEFLKRNNQLLKSVLQTDKGNITVIMEKKTNMTRKCLKC